MTGIRGFIVQRRRLINVILPIVAIVVIYSYITCTSSCPLIKGYLAGIKLEHLGLIYMVGVLIFSLLKERIYLLSLLSLGFGSEIFLISYQIHLGTFCPYCLIFGGLLILQFIINFERKEMRLLILLTIIGLLIFPLALKVENVAYGEVTGHKLPSSFGEGKITVRLYTNYFCPPCKALEPELENLVRTLVNENIINVTFIDTPSSALSVLYARYFLFSLGQTQTSLDYAFSVRKALIEASNMMIDTQEKLESFLESKGIKISKFDPRQIFDVYTRYLREDKVNATPTCVIIRDGKKETHVGGREIVEALKALLKK